MSYSIDQSFLLTNKVHKDSLKKYGHKYIVVHYFGALGTAKNTAKYFHDSTVRSSAHFCVDEQSVIYQCVDLDNGAWHCGRTYDENKKTDGPCNLNSIGIEIRPNKINRNSTSGEDVDWYYEQAAYLNSIDLISDLMIKYNIDIDHVVRHYDCTKKLCPSHMCRDKVMTYYNKTGNAVWQQYKADLVAAVSSKTGNANDYKTGDVVYLNDDCEADSLIEQLLSPSHQLTIVSIKDDTLTCLTQLQIKSSMTHPKQDELIITAVEPYKVRVEQPIYYYDIPTKNSKTNGQINDIPGIYTIVAESNTGFGKLKSGAGWILLSEVKKC